MTDASFNSPRRWAGRLAFPFAAGAVVLALQAMNADGHWAWWVAAAASAGLGIACLRLSRR